MDVLNAHRLVHVPPGAGPFAGMVTYSSTYGGEGVSLFEEFEPFPVFPFTRQGHKPLDAHVGRTGDLARGRCPFGDSIGPRHGLGILLVNSLSYGKALIVAVPRFDGAYLGAFAAARALGHIYVSGMLEHARLEVPFFPIQFQEFCRRKQFDVQVPADLDQFGRDDSHGAVIGGKCLVELRHETTNGRGPLHEVHIKS